MFKKHIILVLTIFVLIVVGCSTVNSRQSDIDAVTAAKIWLSMIDAGKYEDSWNESSELFRKAVTPANWQRSMEAVRKPLGSLVSRKIKSKKHYTSLPGAPDGEYVVIEFTTSFSNKKSAVETVTPMMDKDGKWRVSGYYIK